MSEESTFRSVIRTEETKSKLLATYSDGHSTEYKKSYLNQQRRDLTEEEFEKRFGFSTNRWS